MQSQAGNGRNNALSQVQSGCRVVFTSNDKLASDYADGCLSSPLVLVHARERNSSRGTRPETFQLFRVSSVCPVRVRRGTYGLSKRPSLLFKVLARNLRETRKKTASYRDATFSKYMYEKKNWVELIKGLVKYERISRRSRLKLQNSVQVNKISG